MDYDIGAAFEAIEDELIASMIRNMDHHRVWEDDEGIQWSMWQAEQLKALEKYKKANQKRYGKQFKNINGQIGEILYKARQNGNMQQEIQILNAIKNGFTGVNKVTQGAAAEFFRLNDRKLEALIEATTNDMERAETAILRKANDEYRKAIYNAQVYANTGAGTYEKAVDMATKDMLSRGLACVEYANGARHTLVDYADMAIRAASKRAYLQGEGEKRQEWGITTVIMVKRGNPCPKCLPFVGKVLIDDVWSGGKKSDGPYPLMSKAIAAGLYHPRCKDSHTTYFPGISTADDSWTKEELESIEQVNVAESKQQYAKRQIEKFGRLAKYSLDKDNIERYEQKRKEWEETADFKQYSYSAKFVNRNEALYRFSANIEPLEGFEDIVCHADPDGFLINLSDGGVVNYTPAEFVKILRESKGYHGGNIRLIACESGQKENGAAQQLADLLGVEVYAPTEIVHVDQDGNLFVSNSEVLAEMWYNGEEVKETGKWVIFKPKEGR